MKDVELSVTNVKMCLKKKCKIFYDFNEVKHLQEILKF